MKRRNFLSKIGLSATALGLAGGSSVAPSVHCATRLFTENIKVTGVKTLLIDNIPPYAGQAKWLFVQLLTDQGVIGLGERPTGGISNLEPQMSLIHDLCERYVLAQLPHPGIQLH